MLFALGVVAIVGMGEGFWGALPHLIFECARIGHCSLSLNLLGLGLLIPLSLGQQDLFYERLYSLVILCRLEAIAQIPAKCFYSLVPCNALYLL